MQIPLHTDMTLKELLSHECGIFGDYILLSFVPNGDKTQINLTSTDLQPVRYSVLVNDALDVDFQDLRFNAYR